MPQNPMLPPPCPPLLTLETQEEEAHTPKTPLCTLTQLGAGGLSSGRRSPSQATEKREGPFFFFFFLPHTHAHHRLDAKGRRRSLFSVSSSFSHDLSSYCCHTRKKKRRGSKVCFYLRQPPMPTVCNLQREGGTFFAAAAASYKRWKGVGGRWCSFLVGINSHSRRRFPSQSRAAAAAAVAVAAAAAVTARRILVSSSGGKRRRRRRATNGRTHESPCSSLSLKP